MDISFSSYINFAILTQCIFSIVYLVSFQWQKNRWITLFISIIFLDQFGIFITEDNLSFSQKLLIGNPGMILWLPPSIYFFTKDLVSLKIKQLEIVKHFLLGFIFYLIFLFTETYQPKHFFTLLSEGKIVYTHLSHLILLFLTIIYYVFAILKLIRYNKEKVKSEYAEETIFLTLDWLKYTVWIFFIVSLGGFFTMMFSVIIKNVLIPVEGIEITFLLLVMVMSFFAFRQPTLYQSVAEEEVNIPEVKTDSNKIEKMSAAKALLSADEITQLSADIDTYFLEKQPFLNIDIRLPDIANALKISANGLSWYLNEHHQMNFFTFINQYRIQHAVELLKNEDFKHYTLEAISKMSGFRSKTTFNNRFKEIMNETPSSFRNNLP